MSLPIAPPVAPMLARLAGVLPAGGAHLFEPKWDGFRCLAFRDGAEVELRSRHDRPFTRYFPEVAAALVTLPCERFVVDGELLADDGGHFEFEALQNRLHPAASRVRLLAERTPACYLVFDVLATVTTRHG